MGGTCADPNRASTFGDFFGLTQAPDGRLWMAGLTSAGAIHWKPDLTEWVQSWAPHNPFDPAFGDPYPGNPPVFNPPVEGDPVNLRAVSVTPDGTVWFASGEVEAWRGPTYGLASFDGQRFLHVDPISLGRLSIIFSKCRRSPTAVSCSASRPRGCWSGSRAIPRVIA